MLIDTHCHINISVKKTFDIPLTEENYIQAQNIVEQSINAGVTTILNVATSRIESKNCIELARRFSACYASVGIHPNDLTKEWRTDFDTLKTYLNNKEELKIVGIGECGIDTHYPEYNLAQQQDAFKAQIELALEHDLGLIVHSRDAAEETLRILEEYKDNNLRATIHCFSYDLPFAQEVISWGFVLGIGGTVTYPKNQVFRDVVKTVGLSHIVLETDAPYLAPQWIRGKENSPAQIRYIADFIGELLETDPQVVAQKTTENARNLFKL